MDNADEVRKWLEAKQAKVQEGMVRMNYRIGSLVKDTSVRYAPKSPSEAEKKKASTATAKQWKSARKRRTDRATSRAKPGGLMRSIQFRATQEFAEVFVAANSEAGKYAFGIHELKGVVWNERGAGTVAKGSQADDKFISRAINDKRDDIRKIAEDQTAKSLQGD